MFKDYIKDNFSIYELRFFALMTNMNPIYYYDKLKFDFTASVTKVNNNIDVAELKFKSFEDVSFKLTDLIYEIVEKNTERFKKELYAKTVGLFVSLLAIAFMLLHSTIQMNFGLLFLLGIMPIIFYVFLKKTNYINNKIISFQEKEKCRLVNIMLENIKDILSMR